MFTVWLCFNIATARSPSTEGAYCCDSLSGNKVYNGNFEYGNAFFSSEYNYQYDTLPGRYIVTDTATQFGANVEDHSYCESSSAYPTNKKFLLINGLTSQSAGSTAVVWEQTIVGLKSGSEYRFCGNFKNMPQCTFDVLPKVTVKLSTGVSRTVTIDTDSDNDCDWQKISFCFVAEEEVTVKILLREDSLGDGNDLAVDDISVQELVDPTLSTTVMHQWGTQSVVASINTLFNPNDDYLPYDPAECEHQWFWYVLTLQSYGVVDWSAPYGFGNFIASAIFNPMSFGPSWHLTTTFPGFTFASGKMYVVGMVTPRCCEECIDDGWTAHLVNINSNPFGGTIPFVREDSQDKSNKGKDTDLKSPGALRSKSINMLGQSDEVTSSRSVEEEKRLLINERDLGLMKDLLQKLESSATYLQLLKKHELSKPSLHI